MHLILLRLTQALYWPQLRNQLWYQKKGSSENRRLIHPLMRTLTSTFCRSSSHPLITFHAHHSELLIVLLDSSIIQRLSNTSTQQFDNSRPLSCISIQMRSQKENLILIHRKTCTSSTARAVLVISSSQKLKEMVGSFSESRPRSLQSLSFISAIRAPLDLRRNGKKTVG